MSSGPKSSCAALISPPHNALAWVHSTAFGRAVVPEVYCTANGAVGSQGRAGRSDASPQIAPNDWTRGDQRGGATLTPASVSVTAIQQSFPVDSSTIAAKPGCVPAPTTLL